MTTQRHYNTKCTLNYPSILAGFTQGNWDHRAGNTCELFLLLLCYWHLGDFSPFCYKTYIHTYSRLCVSFVMVKLPSFSSRRPSLPRLPKWRIIQSTLCVVVTLGCRYWGCLCCTIFAISAGAMRSLCTDLCLLCALLSELHTTPDLLTGIQRPLSGLKCGWKGEMLDVCWLKPWYW